ncbi:vesicle formation at the endoplasmic reticulum [Aspergillus hancockii]|nr:vesicle formation at the endoplasmic reticulum [Aspergillus hancockii]
MDLCDDFYEFLHCYAPNMEDTNFTVVTINDGLNLQNSSKVSSEASMDNYTAGRGPVVRRRGEYDISESENEPYLKQLHYLLDHPGEELPAVLSTSYQNVPETHAKVTFNMFAQLSVRSVSIIFSSGDSGVGDSCMTNSGTNRTRLQPIYAATCPFVTSVGGTYDMKPEKAYVFMDQGNFQMWDTRYVARQWMLSSRTLICLYTATAPVFAAIISRLNAARLQENKPRPGFLTPWLYSLNQTGFTHIVDGVPLGCSSDTGPGGAVCKLKYDARMGSRYGSWNVLL